MRTTTNIYLFNLAVADLATLLFAMPSELYLMWRQYPWTLGEVHISFVLYNIRDQESKVKTFKFSKLLLYLAPCYIESSYTFIKLVDEEGMSLNIVIPNLQQKDSGSQ